MDESHVNARWKKASYGNHPHIAGLHSKHTIDHAHAIVAFLDSLLAAWKVGRHALALSLREHRSVRVITGHLWVEFVLSERIWTTFNTKADTEARENVPVRPLPIMIDLSGMGFKCSA